MLCSWVEFAFTIMMKREVDILMNAFCIFDDFLPEYLNQLKKVGIITTSVEKGNSRPTDEEMKAIIEEYPIVIIGTSQKIQEWMWENVNTSRIVATASVGVDHIKVPKDKESLLTILNAPTANANSVAEYSVGAMLLARKRFLEGSVLYSEGKNNKCLIRRPENIQGSIIGLVGAGRISARIMELLQPFGVQFLCYTKNPGHHRDLTDRFRVDFVQLEELSANADIISVNVPSDSTTDNLINETIIGKMKNTAIYISVSRASVTDNIALFEKAKREDGFYVVLDLDPYSDYASMVNGRNVIITPHIAGGTIEARKRMFEEITNRIIQYTTVGINQSVVQTGL